jgi:nucleotidyltransferase/DNA polymerase involved in DNA repair
MYLVSMDVDSQNLMDSLHSPFSSAAPLSAAPITVAGGVASALGVDSISHIGPLNEGLNAICLPAACETAKTMRRVVSGLYGPSATHDGSTPMRQITWSDSSGLFRRFHYANNLLGEREYRVEHRPLWSDSLSWRSLATQDGGKLPLMDRSLYETVYALGKDQMLAPQVLWNLARQHGLLQSEVPTYTSPIPTAENEDLHQRRAVLAREIQYLDRLPQQDRPHATRDELLSERNRLLQEIELLQRTIPSESELNEKRSYNSQREQYQRDLVEATKQAEKLGEQISWLRKEQQRLVTELHAVATLPKVSTSSKPAIVSQPIVPVVTQSQMERLNDIDTQLTHWQRTAAEIVAHRQQLEQSASQLRVEQQNDLTSPFVSVDPREPLRALESQLLQTRRQLEELADGYHHGSRGNNPLDIALPSTLKSMQENLYEVCRQISRKESDTAARKLQEQIEQLGRCEKELQTAIDTLLVDRIQFLQRIAADLGIHVEQLKLKLPYQCGCERHATSLQSCQANQLPLKEEVAIQKSIEDAAELSIRQKLNETEMRLRVAQGDHAATLVEVRRLEERLKNLSSVRVVDTSVLYSLREQLGRIDQKLRHWERVDHLRAELRELDRRILELRVSEYRQPYLLDSGLYASVHAWHEKLTAVPAQAIQGRPLPSWAQDQQWNYGYAGMMFSHNGENRFPHEVVSGRSMEEYRLAIMAIRLAMVEMMLSRGHYAPLLIDDVWNELSVSAAKQLMSILAEVARRGVQVVLLTVDARVIALARAHQAWISHVRSSVERVVEPIAVPVKKEQAKPVVDNEEVNRRLHAIADEMYFPQEPNVLPLRLAETPVAIEKKAKVKTYYVDNRGPFYLSRSSHIEDAPSMDEAMAARLRRVGIRTIGQLLDSNPKQVSLRLEETSDADFHQTNTFHAVPAATRPNRYVSAKKVARWQAESRLVCEVPNVRAFDSRMMVGCGIRTARRLKILTPRQLARRVERFLQTKRGQQVLRSGNGYEVARITSWIVEANRDQKKIRDLEKAKGKGTLNRDLPATERSLSRKKRKRLGLQKPEREEEIAEPKYAEATKSVKRKKVIQPVVATRTVMDQAETKSHATTKVLKFFLSQDRPVVDAPSIGPKVAQRMNNCGIFTVRDFLQEDAESLASRLGEARVSGDVIRTWQQQSQLVCRVPDLRGHDAQLLVAVGITSPERLAKTVPAKLYEEIRVMAESSQGKRMLRGGSAPDLDEVRSWVQSAGLCRPLAAA